MKTRKVVRVLFSVAVDGEAWRAHRTSPQPYYVFELDGPVRVGKASGSVVCGILRQDSHGGGSLC
jgi:hypothetical protein